MPVVDFTKDASPPVMRIIANFIINEIDPRRKKRGLSWSEVHVKPIHLRIMAEAKYHGAIDTRFVRQWLDKDHAWD